MNPSEEEELAALRQEVRVLRRRVVELQRRAARYKEEGERSDFSGVQVSISEREELLVEAERVAHMGSWVWNVEQNTVFWSDELFRILGYDPDKDSASVEGFFARVHPDDLERVQAGSAESLRTGVPEPTEHRIKRPDGSVRYVLTAGVVLFDEAGKLRRIVGTMLDQTEAREASREKRRAHELLEQAQRIAQLGNWSFRVGSGAVEWSREFYRILGLDPSLPASDELFVAHVHPDDREHLARVHELAQREKLEQEADARILRPDGATRHVRIKGVPIFDAEGKLQEIRGTMLDVTEQVELRERLSQAEKMEAVGRLAGGVAHDFNNLLTVISGNLELMKEDASELSEEITESARAVKSAQSLVHRLLAFSRKARLDRKKIAPNTLLEETLSLLNRVIGDQIRIEAEFGAGVLPVEVDPAQIEQCLINLVTNARDAMSEGGRVRLTTRMVEDDDSTPWVEIEVADEGVGMDERTRRSVFEPFYTTKDVGRGTGLGLAMVLGTIEQHGGSVEVESSVGEGSRFRLRLPPASEAEPAAGPSEFSPETASAPVKARILIVEDEPQVRRVIARGLMKDGHEVLLAETPSAAERLVAEGARFDVMVCDVVMPEMRGPRLLRRLRDRGASFEVLFVTGYNEEALEERIEDAVLAKPFTPAQIRVAVQQLIGRRGRRDE